MSDLFLPLQELIERATQLPEEGPASRLKKRMDDATGTIVVLADTSGSMDDLIGSHNLTKHQQLKIALKDVLAFYPHIRLLSFGMSVKELKTVDDLPEPCGGTPLHSALHKAAKWKPRKTIIITDGMPDNEALAEDAVEALTGVIDTIYCGPDAHPAAAWLSKLAREVGGVSVVFNGYRGELTGVVRGLLE